MLRTVGIAIALTASVTGCASPAPAAPRWAAVLVNGGGDASSNYASHRAHLVAVHSALLGRGIPATAIQVLASDGADPTPDLTVLETPAETSRVPDWLRSEGALFSPEGPAAGEVPTMTVVDTAWDRGPVAPATRASIQAALRATDLHAGDTLLLYTTDHGEENGALTLWGESYPPPALLEDLRLVPEGVRIVVAMSQCFSGAFARPLLELRRAGVDVCGVFSVPEDRQATGCFPDRDGPPIGHAFRFAEGLGVAPDFASLQAWLRVADRGPDVPLSTSDVWAWDRLIADAGPDAVVARVDALLLQADDADAADIAQLSALAAFIGGRRPHSMAELRQWSEARGYALDRAAYAAEAYWWHASMLSAELQENVWLTGTSPETWQADLTAAVSEAGVQNIGPALWQRFQAADDDAWAHSVAEAVVARMGWNFARVAARHLPLSPEDAAFVDGLHQCEATPLPGAAASLPTPAWSVAPSASPPELPWFGLTFDPDPRGARILAVHPEGPAAGRLTAGMVIEAVDGAQAQPLAAMEARLLLHTRGDSVDFLPVGGSLVSVPVLARPPMLAPTMPLLEGDIAPPALAWLQQAVPGGAVWTWVAPDCPTCRDAAAHGAVVAEELGYTAIVIDDGLRTGIPDAIFDPGGWSADAFGVSVLPTLVVVDNNSRIIGRVDGWEPGAGIDLPLDRLLRAATGASNHGGESDGEGFRSHP